MCLGHLAYELSMESGSPPGSVSGIHSNKQNQLSVQLKRRPCLASQISLFALGKWRCVQLETPPQSVIHKLF